MITDKCKEAGDSIPWNGSLPSKQTDFAMTITPTPHFLLFSEARSSRHMGDDTGKSLAVGTWRFVLEAVDGTSRLEVMDREPGADAERLELLAVVRGLEALDQRSRVTLITRSSTISRGLRFGLAHWRESDWLWEDFGRMTPVKDADLWQRVDRALQFHQVRYRTWRFDPPQAQSVRPIADRLRGRLRKQAAVVPARTAVATRQVPAPQVIGHSSNSQSVATSSVKRSLTQRIGTVLTAPWQAWRRVAKGTPTSRERVA